VSTLNRPTTLLDDLVLGESPRWHDDRLWLCDWGAGEVIAVDPAGTSEVMTRVQAFPFCIDWLPDGRLLVVAAAQLLRQEPDGMAVHADLSGISVKPWNDIAVDRSGHAYVNNIGFDFPGGDYVLGTIAVVNPDGTARQVADGLAFPNGMAVTPDGSTLIVAESYGHQLTAYDIEANGGLANRRVWARLGDQAAPDGIAIDSENAVWYADVPNKCCVRVREGGVVVQTVQLDLGCFACALGGSDGRTLFMTVADWPGAMAPGGPRTGKVVTTQVPVRG
jgi:sugar lactone lactonase YvrE